MLLPALTSLVERNGPGGGKEQRLGAGQPSSGTLQLTWLWPALLGLLLAGTAKLSVTFVDFFSCCILFHPTTLSTIAG